MKSYILCIILCLFFNFSFSQETIRIPDVALEEALINLKIDTNGLNGTILVSDARYVVNLNVSDPLNNKDLPNVHSRIKDLTGIEHFENLKRLDCYGNEIHTINLKENKELSFLNCSGNKITSLDLSKNSNLFFVSCDSNKLTSLKLGDKPKLTELYCNVNRLSLLDLKNCPVLESIDVSGNPIKEVLVNTAIINSIPEGWYKDEKTQYVTSFGVKPNKPTTKKESKPLTEVKKATPAVEKKVYDETFKQKIASEFDSIILNDEYLKLKKEELQKKYKLNSEEITNWINQYSKIMKIKK